MIATPQTDNAGSPLRVYVLDLLAVVPYYTMNLCAALVRQAGLRTVCGSTTYHRDAGFHAGRGVRLDAGAINLSWKLGWARPALRRIARLAEYLLNLVLIAARFTVSRPDVMHVQFLPLLSLGMPFEIWLLRYCRAIGIRLCCTVHNVVPHDSGQRERARWDRVYKLMDALICHDQQSAARLAAEFGIDAAAITVIAHGPMFGASGGVSEAEAKRELGYADDCQLVLCQGIIRPYKGVPFLLEAWPAVARAAPEARLIVAGHAEQPIREELEAAVERLGIADSVRLDLRFLPTQMVELYHQAAGILVYPYREITTSGSLMTGMATGKAVVATRLPAFEELLRQEESALMVDYGKTDELAGALARLIHDAGLRQNLGEGLRRAASTLPGWDEIAQQTAEFYSGMAAANGPRRRNSHAMTPKADVNL
jgi:glycosyltransferase involved in cell wall biosynthesis